MKSAPIILLLLLLTIILISCRIEKRHYRPGYYVEYNTKPKLATTPYERKNFIGYSLNAYNALSIKPTCEKIIDASVPNEIVGDEGTIIQIPKDAFVMQNGAPIKCDMVNITLKEFYKTSDILEAGLTTTSNNKILASGGMLHIEATCCAEKLGLKQGKKIKIYMNAYYPEKNMRLFTGNMQNGIVNWNAKAEAKITYNIPSIEPENNSDYSRNYNSSNIFYDTVSVSDNSETGEVVVALSSTSDFYGEGEGESAMYLMESSKLGWINCDRFYDVQEPARLAVKADSIEKSCVALIFKNMKSVLPGYAYSNKTVEFNQLPKGEDVSIIVYRIDKKNNIAWYGTQDITIGDTTMVRMEVNEMVISDFKEELKTFNGI